MEKLITNAFSLNMLNDLSSNIQTVQVSSQQARYFISKFCPESVVGHKDVAEVMGEDLGDMFIPFNRVSVHLEDEAILLIGQYVGPRLPEGTKTLPEGSEIRWVLMGINTQVLYKYYREPQVVAGGCAYCEGDVVIPAGHSFGECESCGTTKYPVYSV